MKRKEIISFVFADLHWFHWVWSNWSICRNIRSILFMVILLPTQPTPLVPRVGGKILLKCGAFTLAGRTKDNSSQTVADEQTLSPNEKQKPQQQKRGKFHRMEQSFASHRTLVVIATFYFSLQHYIWDLLLRECLNWSIRFSGDRSCVRVCTLYSVHCLFRYRFASSSTLYTS